MDPLAERLKNMTPLQRAVFALRETQARLDALERKRTEPIAIVGMACRFPGGAGDPGSYWRLICDGVDAVSEVPPDRWNVDDFYDPDPAAPGKMNSRWGAFVDGVDEFDNHFFGISDREAARIDPQQRMLLELAWEALEDAGLPPSRLRGAKMGVFVGISLSDYGMLLGSDLAQTDAHAATGTSLCLAANRLSFAFGFQGPSLALDTACSSSLVAVHLACQHIRSGECEAALAGGVSLLLLPFGTINLTKAGFCAADGRVRAFDAAASGYVRGEGAGLVVLKPLSSALQNNDPIYAVIRGSAVNQNGSSNGLTAPSRAAQEQVLREAYRRSQVSPAEVQYVETQGTGTRLGDTIEALALGSVLREGRPSDDRCAIGSVKTNIGHLEASSGIASLMKAALALQHRQLPPSLHFQTPNPDIPFDALPLRVQRQLEPWPQAAHPRRAGVSAFGFGGSNSHAVLEESPDAAPESHAPAAHGLSLLPLSARTEKALADLAARYADFLDDSPPNWADVCQTAAARRDHHDCRLAVLAESHEAAIDLLRSFLAGQARPGVFVGRKPFGRSVKIALVFDDQAERWKPVVRQLAEMIGFTEAAETVDAALQRVAGWPLATAWNNDARWDDPAWAAVAMIALQLAMTAWWRRAGIVPDVVLGRGSGELAAAEAAGILTAEQVLRWTANGGQMPDDAMRGRPALLPMLSTVDGRLHQGPDLDAAHWRSCLQRTGDLTTTIDAFAQRHIDVCLELGPASLSESLRRLVAEDQCQQVLPSLSSVDGSGAEATIALAAMYAVGADFLWERLVPAGARCVRIPTYPWQRQRLWAPRKGWSASSVDEEAPQPQVSATIRRRPDLTVPYVAPRTKLEQSLVQAWSDVVRVEGIGVFDNFFELGGDSLQATILLNRLQEEFGGEVPSHALFQVQTISDLAEYLQSQCAEAIRRQFPDEAVAGGNGHPARGGQSAIPRLDRGEDAGDLLARLDELSDDEVEAMLGNAAAEDEANQTDHE